MDTFTRSLQQRHFSRVREHFDELVEFLRRFVEVPQDSVTRSFTASRTGRQCGNRTAEFSAPTGKIPQARLTGGRETLKRSGFPEAPRLFWLAQLLPYGWRASGVSSSSLFDRADAGSWARRRPALQGLVSPRHLCGVSTSGLNDVRKRERPRQLRKRCRGGGRVCPRRCAPHGCCSGRSERPRGSSVPIGPSAY